MCNSNVPQREEVVINQNGIGATNTASTEQLQFHLSAISTVMMVLLGLLIILGLYFVFKCYKNCHHGWINDQIVRSNLRRSFSRTRAIPAFPIDAQPDATCSSCTTRGRPTEEFQIKATI